MSQFFRKRGFFAPCGDGILFSPSLGETAIARPKGLVEPIATIAQLVDSGQSLPGSLQAVGLFLCQQDYLQKEPAGTEIVEIDSQGCHHWQAWHRSALVAASPGWHLFRDDGQGRGWLYHWQPRLGPCLECLARRWLSGYRLSREVFEILWNCGPIAWCLETQKREVPEWNSQWTPGTVAVWQQGTWSAQRLDRRPNCPHPDCGPNPNPVILESDCGPLALITSRRQWKPRPDRAAVQVAVSASLGEAGATVLHWPQTSLGGGCSQETSAAALAATGEAIERYCAHFPAPTTKSKWKPSDQIWVPLRYHPKQKLANPKPGLSLHWLWAQTLETKSRRIRVTAQQVYLSPSPDPEICPSLSHGLSCHSDLETALIGGLWELIERDAVSQFWVGLHQPGLAQSTCRRQETEPNRTFFYLEGLAGTTVLCLLTDHGRPVFGSATRWSRAQAESKAYWEACHNLQFLQDFPPDPVSDSPGSFVEHFSYYWQRPECFPWSLLEQIPLGQPLGTEAAEPSSLELAQKLPVSCAYVDLTTADAADWGCKVVRVLAPQLLSLPAQHSHWPTGLARWTQLFGAASSPRLPHPFG